MKYDIVQTAIEQYFVDNWTETAVQYDNVAFNSELYTEYVRCHVAFGDSLPRSISRGCYRQTGMLMVSVFTKPASGSQRRLEIASAAAEMFRSIVVAPVAPAMDPKTNILEPSIVIDNKESNGWVQAVMSFPFYYDLRT